MPYFEQNSRDTGGRGHGDTYMHPFRVMISNNNVYVYPGWVYAGKNGRAYDKCEVKISTTALGDPFLGVAMPYLALETGILWIKVTFASNGLLSSALIEYATEGVAKDTALVKYIRLAKTYTSRLVEQYLKSDVFVGLAEVNHKYFAVTQGTGVSISASAGKILYSVLPVVPSTGIGTQAFNTFDVASVTDESVTDGQYVVVRTSWSASVSGTVYHKLATDSGLTEGGAGPKRTLAQGYMTMTEGWTTEPVSWSVSNIDQLILDSADIVVTSSVDSSTDIILAEIEVGVDDNVTVKQRHDGYIFLLTPWLTYGTGLPD